MAGKGPDAFLLAGAGWLFKLAGSAGPRAIHSSQGVCVFMCGIAGIFNRPDAAATGRMLDAMAHRGPDDRGLFIDHRVSLGHLRLAIIDTSSAAHQPMLSPCGDVAMIFNGEIYNFRHWRAALAAKGYEFRTDSDTEVALALYLRFGDSFLERLRGIFAIALYDRRGGPGREKLLLARDPFGVKPLLYAERSGALVFASELKGLVASGLVAPEIDSSALQGVLALGSVYQPNTLLKDVFSLPSAHAMTVTPQGSKLTRYWRYDVDRNRGLRGRSYAEQADMVSEALRESVRLQMVADVPVGAFLSGGVDSSLIVALMAREAGGRVKTFSVGFEDGAGAPDESHEAAVVAQVLGSDHTRVVVGRTEIVDHLDHFVRALDQPSVDGLNSYFVSHAAAQSVTVALSGTGADEVFLGYPWFAQMRGRFGSNPIGGLPQGFLDRLRGAAPGRDIRIDAQFRDAFGDVYHCFGPEAAHRTLAADRGEAAGAQSYADYHRGNDELVCAGVLDRSSVLCLNSYTRSQLLRDIDACSMSHSLEVRVPFLDTEIVDLALSLSPTAKLAENGNPSLQASYDDSGVKRVVVDAARRYLPQDFFSSRAKRGFSLPHGDWLRGPLAEILADTLSPESVREAGLFDPAAVGSIREGFLTSELPWIHPWLLMVTELWRRQLVQEARRADSRAPQVTGMLH